MDINVDILLERIATLAKNEGISLTNAFIKSGVGKNFKANLKYAKPSMGKITMLANYFGVSVDYLLGKQEDTAQTDKDHAKLSEQEKVLLRLFREATEEERFEMIASVMDIKKRKSSTSSTN